MAAAVVQLCIVELGRWFWAGVDWRLVWGSQCRAIESVHKNEHISGS